MDAMYKIAFSWPSRD